MKISSDGNGSSISAFMLWWHNDVKKKSTKRAIKSVIGSIIVLMVLIPVIYISMETLKKWNVIPIYECEVAAYNAMVENDSNSYVHYKMEIFSGSILKDSTLRTDSEYAADTLFFYPSKRDISTYLRIPLNTYMGDSLIWDSAGSVMPIYMTDAVRMLYYIGHTRSLSKNSNNNIVIKGTNLGINFYYGYINAANYEPFLKTPIAQKYFPGEIKNNIFRRDFALWSAYPTLVSIDTPITMVCTTENSHQNPIYKLLARKDISQAYIKIRAASNIRHFDFDICFTGAVECSPIYPTPDYIDCRTIKFDHITDKSIPKEGIIFHAKFPEQENVQTIRSFVLTMIITLSVTVVLRYLYTLISSIYCIIIKQNRRFRQLGSRRLRGNRRMVDIDKS